MAKEVEEDLVILLDVEGREVENLMDLLYMGTCVKTKQLHVLLKRVLHWQGQLHSANYSENAQKVNGIKHIMVSSDEMNNGEKVSEEGFFNDNHENGYDEPEVILKEESKEEHGKVLNSRGKSAGTKRALLCDDEDEDETDEDKMKAINSYDLDHVVKQINEDPYKSMEKIWNESRHKCTKCNQAFTSILAYEKHVLSDHQEFLDEFYAKERKIKCLYCGDLFLTKLLRNDHFDKVHAKGNKEIVISKNITDFKRQETCPYCRKCFSKINLYLTHVTKHVKGENFWVCKRCDFKTSIVGSLQQHIIKTHLEVASQQDILCSDCGQNFKDSSEFKKHRLNQHRKKQKPRDTNFHKNRPKNHTCEICAESYRTHGSLYEHKKRMHEDPSKIFTCDLCSRKCISPQVFKNHMALHSPPTLLCPHCPKLLHTEHYLKRHIKGVHMADEDKPHRCEQCGKGFLLRVLLDDHMNVHLGLKPFKCRYCENVYQNKSNRMNHEKKSHPDLYSGGDKGKELKEWREKNKTVSLNT